MLFRAIIKQGASLKSQIHFLLLVIISVFVLASEAQAQRQSVGYMVSRGELEDVNFYSIKKGNGALVRQLYSHFNSLRRKPLRDLPSDFDPIITVIKNEIDLSAIKTFRSSVYFVGPTGGVNGEEFNFEKKNLPTKIAKLAFCFGVDPFVLSGIIRQESKFKGRIANKSGASGFMQITDDGMAEANEQLGLLGRGHHGEGAPETFNQYINCYMGPNKKWMNIWEDGTILTKADGTMLDPKNAYVNGWTGIGRRWKYVTRTRKWMGEDLDRNLIYGAIIFKTYLGEHKTYEKAIAQYNVSHPDIYIDNVLGFYKKMRSEFGIISSQKNDLEKTKEDYSLKISTLTLDQLLSPIENRNLWQDIATEDFNCSIPYETFILDLVSHSSMGGFYSHAQIRDSLVNWWSRLGFCRQLRREV